MSTLFDPFQFGPGKTARTRTPRKTPCNAHWDSSWFALRHRTGAPDGPLHRFRADGEHGAVICVCGAVGGRIDLTGTYTPGQPIHACWDCLNQTPTD
jgi:hypothetical protein